MKYLEKSSATLITILFLMACGCTDYDGQTDSSLNHNHSGYESNMEDIEDDFPFVAPTHARSGNEILDAFPFPSLTVNVPYFLPFTQVPESDDPPALN